VSRDGWRPGIVTVIDLIGVKKRAESTEGSTLMRQMHNFVRVRFDNGLDNHAHAYLWNDSILLLAYLNGKPGEKEAIVREADKLKAEVDADLGMPSYGIVVQGEMFPEDPIGSPLTSGQLASEARTTIIKASSYAMANCFTIEAELKKHRKTWYIDTWVADDLNISKPCVTAKVALLPSGKKRMVRMYSGNLW
jgi:hypothetical protein